ncbi:MAG: hypothetical protein K8R48_04880 [Alphaproteobacteria bacterium]|nr:hypothetical protein [Alphaproteobacteria bacterium]
MTQSGEPQLKSKLSLGAIFRGSVNTCVSIVPIISGITLLTISSAAIPVTLGITAIGLGIYHSVITVQGWRKPQAPKPSRLSGAAKVKEWLNNPNKRKSFKLKALIGSAMGAVKLATGMTIAANLGAVSSTLSSGFAAVLSVFGAVTAIGGIVAFGAFAILTLPKILNRVNKFLDKKSPPPAPAAKPVTPDIQPASKLADANAKAGFNASADPATKPATNDNSSQPKNNIAQPKNPAA